MGNPFAHIELAADDVAAAKKFYKSVFDWKLEDMPMGESSYTMINVGKGIGGGMTPKMMGPQQPTAWLAYVEVADVKKTIAKAKAAGATVFVDYQAASATWARLASLRIRKAPPLGVWEAAKKAPAKRAAAKKKPAKKAAKKKGKR